MWIISNSDLRTYIHYLTYGPDLYLDSKIQICLEFHTIKHKLLNKLNLQIQNLKYNYQFNTYIKLNNDDKDKIKNHLNILNNKYLNLSPRTANEIYYCERRLII